MGELSRPSNQSRHRGRAARVLAAVPILVASCVASGVAPALTHAAPPPGVSVTASPALYPGFNVGISDYVTRCTTTPVGLSVSAPPGTDVQVDNRPPQSGAFIADVSLAAGESIVLRTSNGVDTGLYYIRCLPSDFPSWTSALTGQPQAEWYMVIPRGSGTPGAAGNFATIFDTNGVPVWWQRGASPPGLFLNLPNGNVGWSQNPPTSAGAEEHLLNGALARLIDTPGAETDFHEFMLLPNGNYLLGSIVDRPGYDVCGRPNVTVSDRGIQEIAPDGTLVWDWYPSDHIPTSEIPTEWCNSVLNGGTTSGVYDAWHWNSAEPDGSSYVLSFRHMDAIYKIKKSTGEVEWKIGGVPRPESLTIVNDPSNGPWGGHDARVLSDGTVTAHDNGFHPAVRRTPRAVRYQVDTFANTATLIEQVNDPGTVTAGCCGSSRKLPGGNWVMSWGQNPVVTELTAAGSRVFNLGFSNAFSYRAHPVLPGVLSRSALRAGMDAQSPRYARPGSASPMRVPLVPEYAPCTAPNTTHVAPLSLASCTPPALTSSQVTMSSRGSGAAFAKLTVVPGDPGTPADEADVMVNAQVTDVRKRSNGSDYAGDLILRTDIRQTDLSNTADAAATAQDVPFSMPLDCVATAPAATGGSCSLTTTLDTLVPGVAKEGKRAVISAFSFSVMDAGPDGSIAANCPYSCGSGDEGVFLRQGFFTP